MTSLTNIKRDSVWVDPDPTGLVMSSPELLDAPVVRTNATVNLNHGWARSSRAVFSCGVGEFSGIGVAMQQPTDEPEPFRLKAYGNTLAQHQMVAGYGYGNASANITLSSFAYFPMETQIDDVLIMRPSVNQVDKPVVFFVGIIGESEVTDDVALIALSVQRLAQGYDQFSTAIF